MSKSNKKRLKELEEEIAIHHKEIESSNIKSVKTRGRSITVGTAGGGVIEISLRNDDTSIWYLLNPPEAIELIEQIAAACGVYVATAPKQDYASWRDWSTERLCQVKAHDLSWRGTVPNLLSDSGLRAGLPQLTDESSKTKQDSVEETNG